MTARLPSPDHMGSLTNRGSVLQDLERHAEALASYDRALRINPRSPVLLQPGQCIARSGRLDEAPRAMGAALEPKAFDAFNNRGNCVACAAIRGACRLRCGARAEGPP